MLILWFLATLAAPGSGVQRLTAWPPRLAVLPPGCLRSDSSRRVATAAALVGEFEVYFGPAGATRDSVLRRAARMQLRRVAEGTIGDRDRSMTVPMLLTGTYWPELVDGQPPERWPVLAPSNFFPNGPDDPIVRLLASPYGGAVKWSDGTDMEFTALRVTRAGFEGQWASNNGWLVPHREGYFCAVRRSQ